MAAKNNKQSKNKKEETGRCPLCVIMDSLKGKMDEHRDIIDHFVQAKVEVLEGFKKIIDREIGSLRGKKRKKNFSRVDLD